MLETMIAGAACFIATASLILALHNERRAAERVILERRLDEIAK